MSGKIVFDVKFRTFYIDVTGEEEILESSGSLFIQTENIRKAYDLACEELEHFCGDSVVILSVVPVGGV